MDYGKYKKAQRASQKEGKTAKVYRRKNSNVKDALAFKTNKKGKLA